MTHASAAWWTGKKVHENQLERVQRRALRLICAAFQMSPINALEIEASVPPICFVMDDGNRRTAIQFNKLSVHSPIIQRLPDAWRGGSTPTVLPPLPVRPHSSLGAGAAIYHEGAKIFARSIGLGSRAEVYDGELAALLLGAGKVIALAKDNPQIKEIHFFADNTSAINTIFDPKP
ncbi:hypothetical protein B0H19DRAFT_919364, partial [Mycena capillaripes]